MSALFEKRIAFCYPLAYLVCHCWAAGSILRIPQTIGGQKRLKRGSPELRKTLFLAVIALLQKAPPAKPKYFCLLKGKSPVKPYNQRLHRTL